MTQVELGENGFPLEKPAVPATVPFTVRVATSVEALARELEVDLEDLRHHNQELLGGWSRHRRTGQLSHVGELPAGTIVHLPPGTPVPPDDPEEAPAPAPKGKGA
jgi:hypothetical protein